LAIGLAIAGPALPPADAHDIPNQRVDRSIQVTVKPGRLEIDYEVSLTELTLTQDLRDLIGSRPGLDRSEWLALYGQVTGPLNAKGFLITVDGRSTELSAQGYHHVVEEHPRYTFHLEAGIPAQGRLSIRDTNFVSSEGTSRLAIRARNGAALVGYDGPADVEQVPIRPVWELSDDEERRTKEVEARFHATGKPDGAAVVGGDRGGDGPASPQSTEREVPAASLVGVTSRPWASVSRLLDGSRHISWAMLVLIALGLGAAHAIQPGHGKTLVTAVALGPDARSYQPALLGLTTTLAHTGSVLLLAALLWYTGSSRVGTIHQGLVQAAGFAIAAAGLWRIGRHLGGHGEHEIEAIRNVAMDNLSLLGLGLAGGLVPCWDAVGLLILAAALGRLAAGVGLVLAFSAGMALVLVTVGVLAWKLKSAVIGLGRAPAWQRRLGLLCGVILATMGLWLFFQ
jgi:ABC-type nickel/cobalt efflux system permease component RcnA